MTFLEWIGKTHTFYYHRYMSFFNNYPQVILWYNNKYFRQMALWHEMTYDAFALLQQCYFSCTNELAHFKTCLDQTSCLWQRSITYGWLNVINYFRYLYHKIIHRAAHFWFPHWFVCHRKSHGSHSLHYFPGYNLI